MSPAAPAGWRALVGAQAPSRPAPGGLEQVAGLLLVRAAPGETDVRRALLTRWGLDDLDPTSRAACAARIRHAYTRPSSPSPTTPACAGCCSANSPWIARCPSPSCRQVCGAPPAPPRLSPRSRRGSCRTAASRSAAAKPGRRGPDAGLAHPRGPPAAVVLRRPPARHPARARGHRPGGRADTARHERHPGPLSHPAPGQRGVYRLPSATPSRQ